MFSSHVLLILRSTILFLVHRPSKTLGKFVFVVHLKLFHSNPIPAESDHLTISPQGPSYRHHRYHPGRDGRSLKSSDLVEEADLAGGVFVRNRAEPVWGGDVSG